MTDFEHWPEWPTTQRGDVAIMMVPDGWDPGHGWTKIKTPWWKLLWWKLRRKPITRTFWKRYT